MQIEIMKLRKMVTLIFFSKKSKSLSILPSYVSDRFVIIQIFPMGYCLNFRPFHNCVKHINRCLLANHTKRKTTTIRWNSFAPSLTSPEAYLMYTNLKDKFFYYVQSVPFCLATALLCRFNYYRQNTIVCWKSCLLCVQK